VSIASIQPAYNVPVDETAALGRRRPARGWSRGTVYGLSPEGTAQMDQFGGTTSLVVGSASIYNGF